MLRLTLAAALLVAMTSAPLMPAHAGTDCGQGNDYTSSGNSDPSCGGSTDGSSTDGSSPAPLPLAGIPALIAMMGGAGAVAARRRAN